ncbi:DUF3307 domain-containing protein [Tumebacillus lipolyticus]|uniref:DUF3307 domain-containing protein n=1 Tax=Tumebacillus lipolyticus TaxID=1280370 RepID=A0ABW5A0L9_9BACL
MEWLVGHLIGDYLLQNDWMVHHKKEKTLKGELACNLHCAIWTFCVLLCTGWWDWTHAILVFGSHYLLDRTGFVYWYVNRINLERPAAWLYIVVDNVMHLLALFLIDKYV